MKKVFSKDIYDKQGRLLVAKGVEVDVSGYRLQMLEALNVLEEAPDGQDAPDRGVFGFPPQEELERNASYNMIKVIANDFAMRNTIFDSKTLEQATQVVNGIIYDYRTLPWYLYVNALVNYVDWIYAHSVNVSLICCIIGHKLGYSKQDLHNLTLGAILHDIGMLMVPKEILLKPDKLTAEEMNMVRQHCGLGHAMVCNSGVTPDSLGVILSHHERLDGSGYPDHLAKEHIPEFAQITMVADSFDTATSFRPYKITKQPQDILDEMLEKSSDYNESYVRILRSFLLDEQG